MRGTHPTSLSTTPRRTGSAYGQLTASDLPGKPHNTSARRTPRRLGFTATPAIPGSLVNKTPAMCLFAAQASQSNLRNVDISTSAVGNIVQPAVEQKWRQTVARLSRAVRRHRRYDFAPDNLVPRPDPQYWQNAPAAPFGELCTDAAHGVLALLQPANLDDRPP